MGTKKLNESRRNFIRKSALLTGTLLAGSAVKPFSAILFAANEPEETKPWYAIGIDIEKCIGCGNCAKACKSENDVPKEPFYFRSWVEQYTIKNDETLKVESPNGGIDGFEQTIPEDEPHRVQYINDFKTMMESLVSLQREDGFWNPSLHDPNHFGGKELTGTALFAYGTAYGINSGILSREKYLPVLLKAWNGMVKESLHDNGFLGYVQSTGKEPSAGQPLSYDKVPDFEDYGLGCFLLAGSEVYKLKEK